MCIYIHIYIYIYIHTYMLCTCYHTVSRTACMHGPTYVSLCVCPYVGLPVSLSICLFVACPSVVGWAGRDVCKWVCRHYYCN